MQVAVLDPYTESPSIVAAAEQCMYVASDPTINCSPYIVKFGYGYMGEALTPVMEDFPKFISTQIDTTWRRFEILFDDMKQDSQPGSPVAGQPPSALADHRHQDPGQHRPQHLPPDPNWELS